jgi:hypothetical protein
MAALVFVRAGTIWWPQAWAFLIELGVSSVLISAWLYRHDPIGAKPPNRPTFRWLF